ncbi:hypothetical protein ABPG75_012411 [Micractinium tetrahymenae]
MSARDIPVLVKSLAGSEAEQEWAAGALGTIASCGAAERHAVAAAGAMQPLVACLGSDSQRVQQEAAAALQRIVSGSEERASAVYAMDGVPALAALLSSDSEGVQAAAAGALGEVGRSTLAKEAMEEGEVIPALVKCLESDEDRVQGAALRALSRLSYSCPKAFAAAEPAPVLLQAGALPALLQRLEGGGAVANAHSVARMVVALLRDDKKGEGEAGRQALQAAGALPALLRFVSRGNEELAPGRGAAVEALAALAADSAPARQAMAAEGGIPALVHFLHTTTAGSSALAEAFRQGRGPEAGVAAAIGLLDSLAKDSPDGRLAVAAAGAAAVLQAVQASIAGSDESTEAVITELLPDLQAAHEELLSLAQQQQAARAAAAAAATDAAMAALIAEEEGTEAQAGGQAGPWAAKAAAEAAKRQRQKERQQAAKAAGAAGTVAPEGTPEKAASPVNSGMQVGSPAAAAAASPESAGLSQQSAAGSSGAKQKKGGKKKGQQAAVVSGTPDPLDRLAGRLKGVQVEEEGGE